MNVYEIITSKLLEEINKGTIPWHKPWKSAHGEMPSNLDSGKAYRGLNRFLLGHLPYERPYFITYHQAQSLKGQVKKGEKGCPVIFWKREAYTKTNEAGESELTPGFLLRYYTVFNVSQCEGLEGKLPALPVQQPTMFERHATAESLVTGYHSAPSIQHIQGDQAYYRPSTDTVVMPMREQFASQAEYYSTLFHELSHSTGHAMRLHRPTLMDALHFGSTNYSKEELVAELGAAFLCGEAGIDNEAALKNSAAYLDGWRRKLSQDSRVIIQAAAQAQKAADHILGITFEA